MEIALYQIDAFTKNVFSGNPAAVCLLREWLPDATLQAIAGENYLPETAFVVSKNDQHEIRYFKPDGEIELCGHGTLASAYVMIHVLEPWLNEITFESKSGSLLVKKQNDEFLLNFPVRHATPCEILSGLDDALGVMPRQLLIYKNEMYLAILESEKQIRHLKPDFKKLSAINCKKIVVTAPGDRVDFVSRYFKANEAIQEDPVTGTAHCLLMPYWAKRLGKNRLQAKQVSARGGELQCELRQDRVLINGTAAFYLKGSITIPDTLC